jgi:hypothetical protein
VFFSGVDDSLENILDPQQLSEIRSSQYKNYKNHEVFTEPGNPT